MGLGITVVGAGPIGLGTAIEAERRGHDVTILSRVIPDSLELTKLITGGNAAGYGGPFGGKDPLIRSFVESSWGEWMKLARDKDYSPVREIKARILTTDPEFLKYISRFEGFKNSSELKIENCIEIDAYAFNPRAILVEWNLFLREKGVNIRQHNLTADDVKSLRQGESLLGNELTIEAAGIHARDIHPELHLQPIRGVLGHFSASFDPSVTPISIMDEERSDLLYLIPRPGNTPGSWDLVLGGTFDEGVGYCSDTQKEEIIREKFAKTISTLADVAPESINQLKMNPLREVSVDYRPSTLNGSPVFERIQGENGSNVLVVNGARGQGFVPVFSLAQHTLDMAEGFSRRTES